MLVHKDCGQHINVTLRCFHTSNLPLRNHQNPSSHSFKIFGNLGAERAQIDCLYKRLSVGHPGAQNLSYLDPHLYLEKQDEGRAVPVFGRLIGHQLPVKTIERLLAQNATSNLPHA